MPPGDVAPSTAAPGFSFSADSFEESDSSRTAVLQGHARVWDESLVLGSETLILDLDTRVLRSTGPLTIQQEDGTIHASSGSVRADTGDGKIWGVRVSEAPWFFRTDTLSIADGRDVMPRAEFTTCEYSPSDYHVRTSRLELYPDHWVQSWNNVFYLGRWPVFYWPYWYHSLAPGGSALKTKVSVSEDKRNGITVKTDTEIRVSSTVYDHLLADWYENQGLGLGDELDYNKKDSYRGTVYGYNIKERQTGLDRWTVAADHWQHLGGLFSAQARVQDMSDPSFNNDYYRSNDTPVSPTLTNSAALVRQSTFTTTRLSYSRLDDPDPLNPNGFIKTAEDAPRLDFNTSSFRIRRLPGLQQFTAFADRNSTLGRPFEQTSAGGTWNTTGNVPVSRDLTFAPGVGVSETYLTRDNVVDASGAAPVRDDVYRGRYFTTADFNFKSLIGIWDLRHNYTERLAVNSFKGDAGAADHGVEQNLLSLQDRANPTKRSTLIVSSAYDLRRTPANAPAPLEFKDRLQPISAILQVSVWSKLSASINETYKVDAGAQSQQSFIAQADYGSPGQNHAGLGFSKNASNPSQTQWNQSLGLHPKLWSWSLEGSAQWQSGGGAPAKLLASNLQLRKSWHDFEGQVGVISRLHGVLEYQADFRLRFREGAEKPISRPADEAEWYPWRDAMNRR